MEESDEKQLFQEYYESYYQAKPSKRPWNTNYLNEVVSILQVKFRINL